ncbi:hypothetical protein BC936DRAFT_149323 [Jimgerdemannia flammicorona]|uniref:Major facilitator superfamily (MFS) profile domain-containing protein n=1 Tax=Jimgerdemannia flammicorona TaxID=994334 RepID=A0A433D133_9FUNG|nr:hypothetical protein BC936DRAFT_149323 [Jimgerdemannia flammicorona]
MDTVTASAALLLICMILLGFTYVHPIVAMSIFSVALAFGPLPMLSSIPLAASNIGTTILDITVGVIQDRTPRGTYDQVMIFLVAISGVAVLIAAVIWVVNRWVYGGILEMNTEQRKPIMEAKTLLERQDREIRKGVGRTDVWHPVRKRGGGGG